MVHHENGPFLDLIITLVKIIFVVGILITTTMSEEKKTKECPYCGEEILATAKKCKHCGDWLDRPNETDSVLTDEEIDKIAEDAVNEAEAEIEKRFRVIKIVGTALAVIGIGLLMFFMVPSKQKHLAKLESTVEICSNQVVSSLKNIAAQNIYGFVTVSDYITPEITSAVKGIVRSDIVSEFEYTNVLLYSVGEIYGDICQVGLLGFVLDFTPTDEYPHEDIATDLWNQIVTAYNNGYTSAEIAQEFRKVQNSFMNDSGQTSTEPSSSSPDKNHQITSTGIGPIKIGMAVSSLPASIEGMYSYYKPYEEIDDDGYSFYDADGNELFFVSAYQELGSMGPLDNSFKVKIGNKWYGIGDVFPSDKLKMVQDNRYEIDNIAIGLNEDGRTINYIFIYSEEGDQDV